jgi:hypothetical protein
LGVGSSVPSWLNLFFPEGFWAWAKIEKATAVAKKKYLIVLE